MVKMSDSVFEMEPFTRSTIPGKQRGKVRKNQTVLGVLSLIAIGLIVATTLLGIQMTEQKEEFKEVGNICSSKECVTAAGDMIKAMDLTVSPCDDFFQFSCGGWLKNNPETLWNDFDYLWDYYKEKIKEILERKVDESDPMPLNVAKQFYSSCLAQNTTGHEELSELLERVLDQTRLSPNELGEKLGELRREVGGSFIFTTYVSVDWKNTSHHALYVGQPHFGLRRKYLVQSPEHAYKTAYVELIEEMWALIYPDVANKSEIARQLVEFETKLAEISAKDEDSYELKTLYNPMTIRELSELTQNATMINWEKYIEEIFQGVEEIGNDIHSLRVIVGDIPYFTELGNILKNVTEESPHIIWNYLKWRIILKYARYVNNKLRDILFNYEKKTGRWGKTQSPQERWQVCSDEANSFFEMALGYHHVQDAFTSDFQRQMAEMIGDIRQAFYEILNEIDWFGEPETRVEARQKVEKMKTFVGYPDWLLTTSNNHPALRDEYEGLPERIADDHFQNMLELNNWQSTYYLKQINRTKNRFKCTSDRLVDNPFYSLKYNLITFPGGILPPPFFFTGKPIQALNYGAIGVAIGHEITHGFDDAGRESDGDGDWVDRWDEETVTQYTERAQCFIDQYSNYTAEETDKMLLNGNKTIYENIADNGGIPLAFRAYQSFVRKNGVEPRLPGLSYSPQQLFFLALSQAWCGEYSKAGMESQTKRVIHTPYWVRVRGVLRNSIEFAETWNCPRPSDQQICRVW